MGGSILVVDDEAASREGLKGLLSAHGFNVWAAHDGHSALESFPHFQPDLVLLDVMMPELSGFDVCRRLKNNPDTRLTPVVLITGLSETQDRIRGLEAGADDFLSKPIDLSELLARVRSLLSLKVFTDELERAESVLFALACSPLAASARRGNQPGKDLQIQGAPELPDTRGVFQCLQSDRAAHALREQYHAAADAGNLRLRKTESGIGRLAAHRPACGAHHLLIAYSVMRLGIGLMLVGAAFAGDLSLTVAGLRILPERWNKEANLLKFERFARAAAAQGVQLAIAPEGFLEGYVANTKSNPGLTREKYFAIGENIDGPALTRVRSLARELKMYLGLGFAEKVADHIPSVA